MPSRKLRAVRALVCLLTLTPAAAFGFEVVDTIRWPSSGAFPAYPPSEAPRPLTVWAQAGAMHDDNLLRRPDDERSDTIIRYGVGIRGEALVVGRQRVLAEAVGEYFDFSEFSRLDHFAWGLRGEWLWELGNQLSGTLGYRHRRRLVDLAETQAPIRDMITEQRAYGTAFWRFATDWQLTAGAEWGHAEHSARAVAAEGATTVRGGIEHVSPLGNRIGVEVRQTSGDAPVAEEIGIGTFPGNEFEEREVSATLTYALGPELRATGRLGRTERTYSLVRGRDFKGTSGRGSLVWLPGNKTILAVEAYREPAAVLDTFALHVLRKGFAVGPSWAPTLKLVFSARYVQEERDFEGDPALTLGAPLRQDELKFLRFAVGWEPQRFWQVSAGLDHGERSSNDLARNYEYNAVMLNLRFVY